MVSTTRICTNDDEAKEEKDKEKEDWAGRRREASYVFS